MKQCSDCGQVKDSSFFHTRHKSPDGLALVCKSCKQINDKQYRLEKGDELKEKKKEYYEKVKEVVNLKRKEERKKDPEKIQAKEREYWSKNKYKKSKKDKKYRETHSEQSKQSYKNYRAIHKAERNKKEKILRDTNVEYKLTTTLRNRIGKVVRRGYKSGSAVRDLGCNAVFLKWHLESLFQPGMSWDNYGQNGWHIDHIIPLASFDLSNRQQFLKACHYTNLQPLWAEDNLRKGDKVL